MPTSKARVEQLSKLSKEQLAALDDETIDSIVHNIARKGEMKNFEFLQNLTPEEIIKIQQNPYGRGTLNFLINGTYSNEKDLSDLLGFLNEMIGK